MNLNGIPAELKALNQWVLVKLVKRADKILKIPIDAKTLKPASVTNNLTWSSFERTVKCIDQQYPLVGFVLSEDDPYAFVDLDLKEGSNLSLEDVADIIDRMDSFTEISQSGQGAHIIVKGSVPKGKKYGGLEVYSSKRYMVCTGDVDRNVPIRNQQEKLTELYEYIKSQQKDEGADDVEVEDEPEILDDETILSNITGSASAEKFAKLFGGNWKESGDYPSQSEADFALLSYFAFWSKNNAQVKRLFRQSALGKRDKATKNDAYLDRAISTYRSNHREVDFVSPLKIITENFKEPEFEEEVVSATVENVEGDFPPGFVGELARYCTATSYRPVPEIGMAAAFTLMHGICGRAYNVNNMGLNQYMLLLANTGVGKDGLGFALDCILEAVKTKSPLLKQYYGPGRIASGTALYKTLSKQPCFFSVIGEFSHLLKQMMNERANPNMIALKQAFLDVYSKSGGNRIMSGTVYADSEKSINEIRSPSFTMLGECTPQSFYQELTIERITEGFLPRFLIIEYTRNRPCANDNSGFAPSEDMCDRIASIANYAVNIEESNSVIDVSISEEAKETFGKLRVLCDTKVNAGNENNKSLTSELWNRVDTKAIKLAAILAIGDNPIEPVISRKHLDWAINFVKKDVSIIEARFEKGSFGISDSAQLNDLKRVIQNYFKKAKAKDVIEKYRQAGIISHKYVMQRTSCLVSFSNDKIGATNALKRALRSLIESGDIIELSEAKCKSLESSGKLYGVIEL